VKRLAVGELERYLADDRELAWRCAFGLPVAAPLPYRVQRPALPEAGLLRVRVAQPWPCGLRWDRLLAGELGWPRSRIRRAVKRGSIVLGGGRSAAEPVRDGQVVLVALG
jgi:hypothetical protein